MPKKKTKKKTQSRKTVSSVGEFELISKFTKALPEDPDVVLGVGDDCAVIRKSWRTYTLYTTDMLIEDIHFKRAKAKPGQIGHKAMARNISDVAAMGGVPTFAVVSIAMPPKLQVSFAQSLYSGIKRCAENYGVTIVGGDVSKAAKIFISVALMGEVEKKWCVFRKGASVGDEVFVTGTLGGSIAGKHLKFTPRLDESEFLISNFPVTSMIDVSDGLTQDLGHILKASEVGALIHEKSIPVSPAATKRARKNKKKALKAALQEGEDFELLFTVPADKKDALLEKWKRDMKTKLTHIGTITDNRDLVMEDSEGKQQSIKIEGFKHF